MSCRAAVRVVTARLRDVPGVDTLNADAATGELWITGEVLEVDLRHELDVIGFPAAGGSTERLRPRRERPDRCGPRD
jgi:hypothetical protein